MTAETRVHVFCDELYPYYGVTEGSGDVSVVVSAEQAARWAEVSAAFDQMQEEVAAAYRVAKQVDAERARIEKAEAEVAEAQRRLDKARYEQDYPPHMPESWLLPGDGDECFGWQYLSIEEAKAERMRVHNTWPFITFDLKPYVCHAGHHHLRRR